MIQTTMMAVAPLLMVLNTLTSVSAPMNEEDAHKYLRSSIENLGISVVLNDPIACDDPIVHGEYHSTRGRVVVCQVTPGTWSAEDYDTLRHEAHHVVQDCIGRELGDGRYMPSFTEPGSWEEFKQIIGMTDAYEQKMSEIYARQGIDEKGQRIELEAIAVAYGVGAQTLGDVINEVCQADK